MYFALLNFLRLGYTLSHSSHHHDHEDHNKLLTDQNDLIIKKTVKIYLLYASYLFLLKTDINLRAAVLHVIGDLIQSVGVMIASLLIWKKPKWSIVDPICTLLFSVVVFFTTVFVLKDILNVLMEATPSHLSNSQVSGDLLKINGILQVHDLHIWSLSHQKYALTAHLIINSASVSNLILTECQNLLCLKYNIHHTTIQIENDESTHCKDCSQ